MSFFVTKKWIITSEFLSGTSLRQGITVEVIIIYNIITIWRKKP